MDLGVTGVGVLALPAEAAAVAASAGTIVTLPGSRLPAASRAGGRGVRHACSFIRKGWEYEISDNLPVAPTEHRDGVPRPPARPPGLRRDHRRRDHRRRDRRRPRSLAWPALRSGAHSRTSTALCRLPLSLAPARKDSRSGAGRGNFARAGCSVQVLEKFVQNAAVYSWARIPGRALALEVAGRGWPRRDSTARLDPTWCGRQ